MAASSTSPFVEVAEKLAGYATYYPVNASPQGYFRAYLEMAVGLCMHSDAPTAITEEMFTVRGCANISVFLRSPWWQFWRGSLPAMMRDLIPCGLDVAGDWKSSWKDSSFNSSCRESMSQAWINDRMTPESYGKAIVKSCKTFIVS